MLLYCMKQTRRLSIAASGLYNFATCEANTGNQASRSANVLIQSAKHSWEHILYWPTGFQSVSLPADPAAPDL